MSISKFRVGGVDRKIDYLELDNLPSIDATLSISGALADAKAAGDAINAVATAASDTMTAWATGRHEVGVTLIHGSAQDGVITLGGERWVNDAYLPVTYFSTLENRTNNGAYIMHYHLTNGQYVWTKSVQVASGATGEPVPAYGEWIRLFFYSVQTTTNDFTLTKISDTEIKTNKDSAIVSSIFKHEYYTGADNAFVYGRMNETTGGVATSAHDGIHNSLFYCYNAICINVPAGYLVSVNRYRDITAFSTARFEECLITTTNDQVVCVTCSTYPAALMVGIKKGSGDDFTDSEVAAINASVKFYSYVEPPQFASISMFPNWAMTGCSWDAGTIYNTSLGHVTHVGLGWAENVARRSGTTVHNYAIGGTSIRTWFNYENGTQDAHSFKALLTDDAQPLYVLIFGGVNDRDSEVGFAVNDSSYSPSVPSTTTYYVGTIDDISTRNDYTTYPCTFYGYYGRVIEMIKAHAPNARIIISCPDTKLISNAISTALVAATAEIAEYYELPYMDIRTDPYYPHYISHLISDHPTAPTYSGWAMAFERLFSRCVEENYDYFRKWGGSQSTETVAWSKVEL